MFYLKPQNGWEQKQNEAKLEALQADQVAMLSRLFKLNADVLKQLANSLLEKWTINRDELIPFLSRVQFPEGFPRPRP
jgi:hypothetical protein